MDPYIGVAEHATRTACYGEAEVRVTGKNCDLVATHDRMEVSDMYVWDHHEQRSNHEDRLQRYLLRYGAQLAPYGTGKKALKKVVQDIADELREDIVY